MRVSLLSAALICLTLAGCASRRAMERDYYITGQTLEIAEEHALTNLGSDEKATKGTRLMVFRVAEEETHPATGRLSRVRLEPVGLLEVKEATRFRSVAAILEGSGEIETGLYVRLAPPDGLPESWWETASEWWLSFSHRRR